MLLLLRLNLPELAGIAVSISTAQSQSTGFVAITGSAITGQSQSTSLVGDFVYSGSAPNGKSRGKQQKKVAPVVGSVFASNAATISANGGMLINSSVAVSAAQKTKASGSLYDQPMEDFMDLLLMAA